MKVRSRRSQRPASALLGVGRELEGAPQNLSRRRNASTSLSSVGNSFEVRSDFLIGAGGRECEMPGTTIRITCLVSCCRQRGVRRGALTEACAPVGG